MDSYLLAKVALFTRPELQEAVINSDDDAAPVLLGRLNDGVRCITFGAQAGATVRCVAWRKPHPDGMDLRLTVGGEALNVTLPLFGAFNLSNVMAVARGAARSGVEPQAWPTPWPPLPRCPAAWSRSAKPASPPSLSITRTPRTALKKP